MSRTQQPPLAAILSVAGAELTDAEKQLFAEARPAGFILFGRNCINKTQLAALNKQLKEIVGWDCPILIDQEGGKVARLKPPEWPEWPSARKIGETYERDVQAGDAQMRSVASDLAAHLHAVGINVNCAPVLDVGTPEMTEAIGSRCYSSKPDIVAAAGLALCEAFLTEGVTPVIKHLPGHGRATVDSHFHLPVLDVGLDEMRTHDFPPFAHVMQSTVAPRVWGMIAHLMIPAFDEVYPSSLSKTIIAEIIRGECQADGLLVSDDLDMKALQTYGDCLERARISVAAGCDLALYCHGEIGVMQALANGLPPMSDLGLTRLAASGFTAPL